MDLNLTPVEEKLLQNLAQKYTAGDLSLLIVKMAKAIRGLEMTAELSALQTEMAKAEQSAGTGKIFTKSLLESAAKAFEAKQGPTLP